MTYNDTNSKSRVAQLMSISLCFHWIHSGFKSLSPNYQIIKMAYNDNNGCDIARVIKMGFMNVAAKNFVFQDVGSPC